MSLQRQHVLLSYLKTLSVGLAELGLSLRPPAQQSGALPTELTGRQFANRSAVGITFAQVCSKMLQGYPKVTQSDDHACDQR